MAIQKGVEERKKETASDQYDWKRLYGEVGNLLVLKGRVKCG